MARELQRIDVSSTPELLRIAEEVHNTGKPRVLGRDDEDLAVVMPAKAVKRRSHRGRPLTYDDPLWELVGSVSSAEPTDASKKHEYLADAAHRHTV